jgi:hypothetical protein
MKDKFNGPVLGVIIFMFALGLLLFFTGCAGTKKITTDSNASLHRVTTVKADSTSDKVTDIKTFGDTLKGQAVLPVDTLEADTLHEASSGINLTVILRPKHNKAGKITGQEIDYTAIAKPTTNTNIHDVQHSKVSTTNKTDSVSHVKTQTTQSIGWGLPSWIWYVLLAGVVIAVIKYFF